jgi:RNA polymerase sigma factor (TIGR02999 family)
VVVSGRESEKFEAGFRSRLALSRRMLGGMADVTHLLDAAAAGDPRAAAELLPLVYDELRKLAAARMAAERPGQTLDATALVHEAYLRVVGSADPGCEGRGHFFAAAAEAMRRILVENARHKKAARHGGGRERVGLDDAEPAVAGLDLDLLALDDALAKLEREHPRQARVVQLRYFAGLTVPQTAEALGVSRATVENDWAFARNWLWVEMGGERR